MKAIILASASPRRKMLLEQAGIQCEVHPANVSEEVENWDNIDAAVCEVAQRKAEAICGDFVGSFVLSADTIVVATLSNGKKKVLGKPDDDEHAKEMLKLLEGKTHEVISAFVVRHKQLSINESRVVKTQVTFAPMNDQQISWYVATGEANDKAGSYAAQGIGATFIKSINGSYTNVVGLPLAEAVDVLRKCGAI